MLENFFSQVDDECKGWLNGIEAMIALRGVNNRLTMQEEEYLYRVSIYIGSVFTVFDTKKSFLCNME